MIERSVLPQKHDRLAAFLNAYGLQAHPADDPRKANLFITDADGKGSPTHLVYRPHPLGPLAEGGALLAAAAIDFNGSINPLIGALPDELCIGLMLEPQLQGLADLIVSEIRDRRCGGGTIFNRLCEVIVVLAIRKAIAIGTVNAGLLAGLAHRDLHICLVAMHEEPTRNWQINELAKIAQMSRGRFIEAFKQTVGRAPAAYLTEWRLALARVELRSGRSVKYAAAVVGFGSAAAFSRAYSRTFGYAPSREAHLAS